MAATTRAIRGRRNRIAGAFLLQPRDRQALSCRETLIIKVFVYCLANGKPAVRGGGTYRLSLATLHNYAVAPRFVFVMNAPLSSSESIIAGRFCPRACSAVGTCLRNCKETGSAASGRPPVGKYFETSIRATRNEGREQPSINDTGVWLLN